MQLCVNTNGRISKLSIYSIVRRFWLFFLLSFYVCLVRYVIFNENKSLSFYACCAHFNKKIITNRLFASKSVN